jgi:hypothetical protein
MAAGLGITGLVAYVAVSTGFYQQIAATPLIWVVMLAPLAAVLFLSFRVERMSIATAQAVFWGFAAIMGLSLAGILLIYTGTSVARVFFISAGTFAAMSLYGYSTSRDLSRFGSFLFMGLIGLRRFQRTAVCDLRDRRAAVHRAHRLRHTAHKAGVCHHRRCGRPRKARTDGRAYSVSRFYQPLRHAAATHRRSTWPLTIRVDQRASDDVSALLRLNGSGSHQQGWTAVHSADARNSASSARRSQSPSENAGEALG